MAMTGPFSKRHIGIAPTPINHRRWKEHFQANGPCPGFFCFTTPMACVTSLTAIGRSVRLAHLQFSQSAIYEYLSHPHIAMACHVLSKTAWAVTCLVRQGNNLACPAYREAWSTTDTPMRPCGQNSCPGYRRQLGRPPSRPMGLTTCAVAMGPLQTGRGAKSLHSRRHPASNKDR